VAVAVALLMLLGLAGCETLGVGDADGPSFTAPVTYSTLESGDVDTEPLDDGAYGDIKEGTRTVLRSEGAYADFWARLHANRSSVPERPEVDFDEQVVVAVVLGERRSGGYTVEIDDVSGTSGGDRLQVSYTETVPGDNCVVTLALTSPWVLAAVEADGDFSFAKDTETETCK
jgi:hypothetical protein